MAFAFALNNLVPLRALTARDVACLVRSSQKYAPSERLMFSIAVVDAVRMRKVNRQYRGIDASTDVLSFRYSEQEAEIVLSADDIRRQAKEFGHTQQMEAAFLLVHGIVHALGWDHERSAKEARAMREIEHNILRQCHFLFAR